MPQCEAPRNASIAANAASELDAIDLEAENLRRGGASEETVIAHLERRFQALTVQLEKERDERTAHIRASHTPDTRGVIPSQYRKIAGGTLLAFLIGSIWGLSIDEQFIFSAANQYRLAIPWLLIFLLPALAWKLHGLVETNQRITRRYPTWWIRWLIMYPVTIAFSAIILLKLPLCWFAIYGRLCGTPTEGLEAKILRVNDYRPQSRGCHQTADIAINGVSSTICLAKVLSGRTPKVGETVVIAGRVSGAGLYIDVVRTK